MLAIADERWSLSRSFRCPYLPLFENYFFEPGKDKTANCNYVIKHKRDDNNILNGTKQEKELFYWFYTD